MIEPTWVSECGRATLYCGDCRDILPHLSGVDCFVTSPPYNQRIDTFRPSGMHRESRWVSKISKGYRDSLPEHEYQDDQVRVLDMMHNAASNHAVLFYNHKIRYRNGVALIPLDWLRRSNWLLRQEIVWAKNGSCTMNARMFAPSDERIYWMRKTTENKWNQSCVGMMSVWKLASRVESEHPCAFPFEIPRRCILATTDPGDTVCDPYSGSGTTVTAAIMENRRGIGIESDPEYFETAKRRIQEALNAAPLFAQASKG